MGSVFQVILIFLTASCIVETCMVHKGQKPHIPHPFLRPRPPSSPRPLPKPQPPPRPRPLPKPQPPPTPTQKPQPFPKPWDNSCICGRKNAQISGRILGGSEVNVNEYPWMAHIYIKISETYKHCGGSIIDHYHILTAARCIIGSNPKNIVIYLGDHNTLTNSDSIVQIHHVRSFILQEHPQNIESKKVVALLETENKMRFSTIIHPVCLPEPGQDFAGEMATVIGWGKTGQLEKASVVLQEVEVRVLSDKDCKAESKNEIRHFPTILCAMAEKKGICVGDSGGPLMVQNTLGEYEQIGVATFPYACTSLGFPDMYSEVTKYLQWIRNHTGYCSKGQRVNKM